MLILGFILLFSTGVISRVFGACSSFATSVACTGDASCKWNPGSCGTLDSDDCSPGDCAVGCTYTAGTPGKCVNETAIACASKLESVCVGDCQWKSKTCGEPTNPACAVIDRDGTCSSSRCTPQDDYSTCDPFFVLPPAASCAGLSVKSLSKCEVWSEWECKVQGSQCVPASEESHRTPAECSAYSLDTAIGCDTIGEEFCKLANSKCVSELGGPYFDAICNSYSPEPVSECSYNNCTVTDGVCVAVTADQVCGRIPTTGLTICEALGGDMCMVQGSACVGAKECEEYSVDKVTYCSIWSERECKETNGVCVPSSNEVTAEECGQISGGTEISTCEWISGFSCRVNNGVCVSDPHTCKLTQSGNDCDTESRNHGCNYNKRQKCVSACASLDESNCESAGCVLSSVGHCTFANPVLCSTDYDGSCSVSESVCTSTAATSEVCLPNASITCTGASRNTPATCVAVEGCKWRDAFGGECVEKGGDDDDDGAAAVHVPATIATVILALLFAIAF